jgi:hypothetical protein
MIEVRQTEVFPNGLMACMIDKHGDVSMSVFVVYRSAISAMRSRLVKAFRNCE